MFEHGVGVERSTEKAKSYYNKLKSAAVRENRLFTLCFLYCPDELDGIYQSRTTKDDRIDLTYALELVRTGRSCAIKEIANTSCELADQALSYFTETADDPDRLSLYFDLGHKAYMKAIKDQSGSYGSFELPYYYLKKAALGGNKKAIKFLDELPHGKSYVPKRVEP